MKHRYILPRFGFLVKLMMVIIIIQSCATHRPQTGSRLPAVITDNFETKANISHTFFLIGDAGDWDIDNPTVLTQLEHRISKADTSSTLIFLGDNIYPRGMPIKGSNKRMEAERKLNLQLQAAKTFKGRTIFISGNHDWKFGLQGIEEQRKAVNEFLEAPSFFPANGCGIDEIPVNSNTALIIIDSQWVLEDWDDHPGINRECDIITREQMYDQLENLIAKNQNKTTLIAIHHPLMSNGAHGGEFSVIRHLFPVEHNIPLPILGTVMNLVRRTSGMFIEDLQNKRYNQMAQRIRTMIADKANIVVVSGHDHSLQYIEKEGVRQIISGAGSKKEAARAINDRDFSYGDHGYAELKVHNNGAALVSYFGILGEKEQLLFRQQIVHKRPTPDPHKYPEKFNAFKDTTIYAPDMTSRGRFYKFLWGNHYREYYSIPVKVRQVRLDTLFGGLKPTISAGKDDARFLRLQHSSGREFEMHALRKSATQLLQSVVFRDQSVERDFRNTYTEEFILDFYTTAYPYAPFVVSELARNIDLNHTNPRLYFVPKQDALGNYNDQFGDELYLIEERPTNASAKRPRFGKPDAIVSTEDVLAALRTGNAMVDQEEYIKARLFDMLIGDWNRDPDQWSWGEYRRDESVIYRPIPRSREQAFSKFDGALLSIAMNVPAVRHMKSFRKSLKNSRWFNRQAYAMDLAFLTGATEQDWVDQAQVIQNFLTDAEIERAFKKLPNEVQDETADQIKSFVINRKLELQDYAKDYFKILNEKVLIVGTNGNDRFEVIRDGRKTRVRVSTPGGINEYSFDRKLTNELWLYGIAGQDTFEVTGRGTRKIRVRLMGGADHDRYLVSVGKKVTIYDFESQSNDYSEAGDARLALSDSYQLNSYNYQKPAYNVFGALPSIGYNPDDGVKLGAVANYTVNNFNRDPFTHKHTLTANYFFATNGYELRYSGLFPKAFGNWNLVVDALYTSPNFSINFFGFGNETPNYDGNAGFNYNRVKIRTIEAGPSLQWIGESGSSVTAQAMYERYKVAATDGRFIVQPEAINADVFNYKNFTDFNFTYSFENFDNVSNPTLGMTFALQGGYKINLGERSRNFPYAESSLGFTYRLSPSRNWVLATLLKGRALFDDNYEFYHAASVGGDLDLRGFRAQRFLGKQSFFQSTDIRWNVGKLRNGLAPVRYGFFGGFDYGRVWLDDDRSEKWHQSAGGGVWLNGVNLLTAKLSLFVSSDGPRLFFGFGFGF